METRTDRVDRLEKEIVASSGWKIHQQRKAIEMSFLIYEGNFQDVCAVLAYMGNFSNAVKVLAQGNEAQRERVDLDLRRKLFNCLSSAFALIDHTRKFIKGYSSNPDFVAEYQKRVDKNFAKSELHRFFQDYRNYVHHYAIPLLSHTLQFGRDIGESYTCGMQKRICLGGISGVSWQSLGSTNSLIIFRLKKISKRIIKKLQISIHGFLAKSYTFMDRILKKRMS